MLDVCPIAGTGGSSHGCRKTVTGVDPTNGDPMGGSGETHERITGLTVLEARAFHGRDG